MARPVGCTKRIQDSEKTLKDLRGQSQPNAGDLSRITALDKDIASATAQIEKLQQKTGVIQDEIKELEKTWEKRRQDKEARRKEQRENVEKKKRTRGSGKGAKDGEDGDDDDEMDVDDYDG